jgi:hypothetical protein
MKVPAMPTEFVIQNTPALLAVLAAITIPVILMGATMALARIEARDLTRH